MPYEKEKRYVIPFDDVPRPRATMPEIDIESRRNNFLEVETGFSENTALQEATRCLSCRRCLGCALCWAECAPEAIDFSLSDETLDLEFDDVILTRGQENRFERIPPELGYDRLPHVMTDIQAERMLSFTGPTGGRILSPLDGEIPSRLALVQGYPDPDSPHLLSSLILGLNEAILALNRTDGLQVTLVSPLHPVFTQKFLFEAEKIQGLQIVDGIPVSVESSPKSPSVIMTYEVNGRRHQEEIDLVIVLTKPQASPELQALRTKLETDDGA